MAVKGVWGEAAGHGGPAGFAAGVEGGLVCEGGHPVDEVDGLDVDNGVIGAEVFDEGFEFLSIPADGAGGKADEAASDEDIGGVLECDGCDL